MATQQPTENYPETELYEILSKLLTGWFAPAIGDVSLEKDYFHSILNRVLKEDIPGATQMSFFLSC